MDAVSSERWANVLTHAVRAPAYHDAVGWRRPGGGWFLCQGLYQRRRWAEAGRLRLIAMLYQPTVSFLVMAALVAAIHVFGPAGKGVDGRHKAGHDECTTESRSPAMVLYYRL